MQNEENMSSMELEQLRSEYAALRKMLDEQQIVNAELQKKAFRRNLGLMRMDKWSGIIGGAVAVLLILVFVPIGGPDWWVIVAAVAYCLLVMVGVILIYRRADLSEDSREDVLTRAVKLRRFKRNYVLMSVVVLIAAVALLVFAFHIVQVLEGLLSISRRQSVGVLVWLVLIFGFVQYLWGRRILRGCDDVISHLEDGRGVDKCQ